MTVRQPPFAMAGSFPPPLLRAYQTLPFLQDPGGAAVRPMSGVIPRGSGQDWSISVSGSTVTVGNGAAVVAGTEQTAQSGYEVIQDGAMGFTIPAAASGLTRRDRLVVRIRDAAYSGSATDGDVVLVQGVAASTNAQLPGEPANSYTLAVSSVTGSGAPTVTPVWGYTASVGGIRPARGGTVDDGIPPQYAGQYRDLDGALMRGTGPGGVWEPIARSSRWLQWEPTLYSRGSGTDTAIPLGNGGTAIGRYMVQGKACHLRMVFRGGPGYNIGGYGQITTRLPPGIVSASAEETQILAKVNTVNVNGNNVLTGIWDGVGFIPPNTNRVEPYFPLGYDDCRLGAFRAADGPNRPGTGIPKIANSGSYPDLGVLVIQGTIEIQ